MKTILILISSTPSSQKFLTALNLSLALRKQGEGVSLCLLQDAVLGALSPTEQENGSLLERAGASGIPCYSLDEDLAMRGHREGDLMGYVHPISYSELIDVLAEGECQVIGCF